MKVFKALLGAALLAAPLLLASAPSEAKTARQYAEQGRGRYVSSKGRPMGYHGYARHHRMRHHYRR